MTRRSTYRLLLDTHVWYWYVSGSRDLPGSLRDAVDDALGLCWLSPISVWELGVLVTKGRIRLDLDYERWIRLAFTGFPVREAPINFEVAQKVRGLDLEHGDPGDRFLAATALVYDLTLVTMDHRFIAAGLPTLTS